MNLFDTEADKYAAFRELSTSVHDTAGDFIALVKKIGKIITRRFIRCRDVA